MAEPAESRLFSTPPIARTRLIGRESERAIARGFLLDEAVPLLTLTGPGGVGKTRLALAVASDVVNFFGDGVVWVDLAPLIDPGLVAATIAGALDVALTPGRPPREDLARALRARQTLLLLDNCEHVLGEVAALLGALLTACPALQVLATSRAPLRLHGDSFSLSNPCRCRLAIRAPWTGCPRIQPSASLSSAPAPSAPRLP